MADVIKWTVDSMICYPQYEGKTDVVFTVNWRCIGSDGQYNASMYNSQLLVYIAGSPFTPYDDLTQDQVIGWVKEAMGDDEVARIEVVISAQLEHLRNPTQIYLPLPW